MARTLDNQHTASASVQRRYDIDALRVLAFGLLILYHVGMFYVADWHWHVKSNYLSEPLQALMTLVNPWRMPLIFLVSGVATHFLLRKCPPSAFAKSRTQRLLVPLLFGMAVIVPPQAYVQALANGAFEGGYLSFLWRYFTLQPWPPGAFDGSVPVGITWNHLWYLPYLLSYSLILAALLPAMQKRIFHVFINAVHQMRSWQLLLLPALPFLLYEWTLSDRFPTTHAFFNDWDCHAVSFTAFMLGYILGDHADLWRELQRLRWLTLCLAVISYSSLTFMAPQPELTWASRFVVDLLSTFNGWFWLIAVLGWAHYALNRPFRWLPYATEAVYSWYILHQTLTVVAGYYLSQWYLGPVVEPLLVVVITVGGCLVLHEYVVRRVDLLRPLFGMRRRRVPPHVGPLLVSDGR